MSASSWSVGHSSVSVTSSYGSDVTVASKAEMIVPLLAWNSFSDRNLKSSVLFSSTSRNPFQSDGTQVDSFTFRRTPAPCFPE